MKVLNESLYLFILCSIYLSITRINWGAMKYHKPLIENPQYLPHYLFCIFIIYLIIVEYFFTKVKMSKKLKLKIIIY